MPGSTRATTSARQRPAPSTTAASAAGHAHVRQSADRSWWAGERRTSLKGDVSRPVSASGRPGRVIMAPSPRCCLDATYVRHGPHEARWAGQPAAAQGAPQYTATRHLPHLRRGLSGAAARGCRNGEPQHQHWGALTSQMMASLGMGRGFQYGSSSRRGAVDARNAGADSAASAWDTGHTT